MQDNDLDKVYLDTDLFEIDNIIRYLLGAYHYLCFCDPPFCLILLPLNIYTQ